MSRPIDAYAMIGNTETAALVADDGSIDWMCVPRFDGGACFAALLGDRSHGRWQLSPVGGIRRVKRAYREGTLVLDTDFETEDGAVRVTDFMTRPAEQGRLHVVRVVEGVSGSVEMQMDLVIRFEYASIVPWVTRRQGRLRAVGGPDAVTLTTPAPIRGENLSTVARFAVGPGERVPFVLSWHPSHRPAPTPPDAAAALEETQSWWRSWSARCSYRGEWAEAVKSSLLVLKALTFSPTAGIVAAPTTSLPEQPGGVRNWDYRFVWLRDATFTLEALLVAGYREEAVAWCEWLLRTVAGDPSQLQPVYGLSGERRFPEMELDWLPGYEHSTPVRVGNAGASQVQLDVYGEVMDAIHSARSAGMEPDPSAWSLQRNFLEQLEEIWDQPDRGIWEVRGERRHFTHSKVMAWVAFDRAVHSVERHGFDGDVERWRKRRDEIRAEVLDRGYDAARNTFVQAYGSDELDAALLLIPAVGFLPADDPRVVGTVEAVRRELCIDDTLVLRYRTEESVDGLPPGEGAFMLCSFWLVDALAMIGRTEEARARFERLLALRNDVGLLAEQVAPIGGRHLGNFPQAFSHLGLIDSAFNLTGGAGGPARRRAARQGPQS